jgi:hypothetical protein
LKHLLEIQNIMTGFPVFLGESWGGRAHAFTFLDSRDGRGASDGLSPPRAEGPRRASRFAPRMAETPQQKLRSRWPRHGGGSRAAQGGFRYALRTPAPPRCTPRRARTNGQWRENEKKRLLENGEAPQAPPPVFSQPGARQKAGNELQLCRNLDRHFSRHPCLTTFETCGDVQISK